MDPQVNYTTDATAYYLKHQAEALSELMPALRGVRFMRICSGLADMTPDMAPIMEGELGYDGLYLDAGWGYFGFKSGPGRASTWPNTCRAASGRRFSGRFS